jgi:hypothetical protein
MNFLNPIVEGWSGCAVVGHDRQDSDKVRQRRVGGS